MENIIQLLNEFEQFGVKIKTLKLFKITLSEV